MKACSAAAFGRGLPTPAQADGRPRHWNTQVQESKTMQLRAEREGRGAGRVATGKAVRQAPASPHRPHPTSSTCSSGCRLSSRHTSCKQPVALLSGFAPSCQAAARDLPGPDALRRPGDRETRARGAGTGAPGEKPRWHVAHGRRGCCPLHLRAAEECSKLGEPQGKAGREGPRLVCLEAARRHKAVAKHPLIALDACSKGAGSAAGSIGHASP